MDLVPLGLAPVAIATSAWCCPGVLGPCHATRARGLPDRCDNLVRTTPPSAYRAARVAPIADRCYARSARHRGLVLFAAFLLLAGRSAHAQGAPMRLDRATVVVLARERAPVVAVAEARVAEAAALHVGARVLAPTNPEISVFGGPRWVPGGGATSVDLVGLLTWPIDVSGARGARGVLADAQTRAAEASAADARRVAAGNALDLWVRALGADARVRFEAERAQLDLSVAATARARRDAGATGDGDVALAAVLAAAGVARLRTAEGELAALEALLRGALGLDARAAVEPVGPWPLDDPPPLDALLAALPAHRADVLRAALGADAARAEATLQGRLATPLPRVTAGGGHENEYFARVGLDVPLPIYQRNQQGVALAGARIASARAEHDAALAVASTEVRSAYATFAGARAAYAALEASTAEVDDAEHLALRAYELGQTPLDALLVARREVLAIRAAHLDARLALARARLAVDLAAGTAR